MANPMIYHSLILSFSLSIDYLLSGNHFYNDTKISLYIRFFDFKIDQIENILNYGLMIIKYLQF